MNLVRSAGLGLAMAGALFLWGCDRSDAGAPARDHAQGADRGGLAARPRTPTPLLDGKPIWADNREHSAQENVDYQFDHWGSTVGAHDSKDYARKARAFIEHPPKGAEKKARSNGDVMIYDKGSNLFAIVRRDGAPRLFRKPPEGAAAWDKARSESGSGGRSRRYGDSGGRSYSRGGDD